jgi:drug/metabolite transporter (DMT)-like permease
VTGAQLLGLAAALVGALLFGVGAVAQAHAVRRFGGEAPGLAAFVARSVRDPWTMLVVGAYLAGFMLHAVSIWLLPLYLAQAAVAMSLPVTALVSTRVQERLRPDQWWAVVVVTAGLVLLAVGSGDAGAVVTDAAFAACAWAGVALLTLASAFQRRLGGPTLGTLAGLGYAGSAIAVRGVGTPLDGAVVAAALTVPAYGLVAFWLYSLGLDRARVSATTAALIVTQTFVPAFVGVLLLDDGVRPGWSLAVVAGLVLSTAGSVWLSRGPQEPVRSPDATGTASSPDPARPPGRRSRRSP